MHFKILKQISSVFPHDKMSLLLLGEVGEVIAIMYHALIQKTEIIK